MGLAVWLLGIPKPGEMAFHAQRGNLFETLIVSELLNQCWHDGRSSNLYFWRDSKGLEIDLVLEQGEQLLPIEIKSGTTIATDFTDNLKKWSQLSGNPQQQSWLIYGGDQRFASGTTEMIPWRQTGQMF